MYALPVRAFLSYLGASFLLHLVWENAQAPLFEGYVSFAQHFPICLVATATGDMAVMFMLYLLLALAHRNLQWATDARNYAHPLTWILPPVVGALFAIIIELRAVYVLHRWSYGAAMPIVPGLWVGLTPVLQMVVVPLVTLLVCQWWLHASKMSS